MKRWWTIIVIGLVINSAIYGEIQEIHELKQIKQVLSPITKTDWILFDIDYTLTAPDHPMLQMAIIKQNKQRFREELSKFSDEEKKLIPVLMVTQAPSKLLTNESPHLIQELMGLGATVFGFTAIDTGVVPHIGEVPVWRAKELERLGIHFSNYVNSSLPDEKIEFVQFPPFRGAYPLYDKSVLYANVTASKGSVLKAFLDKISEKPTRIVLIDDTLENLQSMQHELDQLGIFFLGLHYVPRENQAEDFSEKQWREVWDIIKKRAEKAIAPVSNH